MIDETIMKYLEEDVCDIRGFDRSTLISYLRLFPVRIAPTMSVPFTADFCLQQQILPQAALAIHTAENVLPLIFLQIFCALALQQMSI